MGTNAITMYRGDTKRITIYVLDEEGLPKDLTNRTLRFTVKKKSIDGDDEAVIGPLIATVADPVTGIGIIYLTVEQSNLTSNTYVFDVQATNLIITPNENDTIIKDDFTIIDDVTKTSAAI